MSVVLVFSQYQIISQVNPFGFCLVFSFIPDSTEDKKLSILICLFRVFCCLFCRGCRVVSTKSSIFTENKTCLEITPLSRWDYFFTSLFQLSGTRLWAISLALENLWGRGQNKRASVTVSVTCSASVISDVISSLPTPALQGARLHVTLIVTLPSLLVLSSSNLVPRVSYLTAPGNSRPWERGCSSPRFSRKRDCLHSTMERASCGILKFSNS